ncbi:MAG: hypothetical protein MZV65_31445 [Chromatiales bacterium]|nr:hypothetical protein [Chromatiales bacterium]
MRTAPMKAARSRAACARCRSAGSADWPRSRLQAAPWAIREVTVRPRAHADSSVVSRLGDRCEAHRRRRPAVRAASRCRDRRTRIELREPSRRGAACARSCRRITRCRARLEHLAPLFTCRVDARACGFSAARMARAVRARPRARDRSRRQRSGLVQLLSSSPQERIAAARVRGLTLDRAIQVRTQTLGPVRGR